MLSIDWIGQQTEEISYEIIFTFFLSFGNDLSCHQNEENTKYSLEAVSVWQDIKHLVTYLSLQERAVLKVLIPSWIGINLFLSSIVGTSGVVQKLLVLRQTYA